jgi:hypothetical protein
MSAEKTRGGGTLILLYDSASGVCVKVTRKWLRNVFGLKYLHPMALIYVSTNTILILTIADTIRRYFGYLDHVLNTHNFSVILLEYFNLPLFDWKRGIPYTISHYNNKLKGEAIFSSTWLLGLYQHNYFLNSGNFLDLVFTYLSINHDVHVLVSLYTHHPPSVTEVLENHVSHPIFLSENTLPVITLCYTIPFPPMIGLPSTVRPLSKQLLTDLLLR